MTNGLDRARTKMQDAGASGAAIDVFSHYYRLVAEGSGGFYIEEDSIDPLLEPPQLASVQVDADAAREALEKTVIIKLNGGLGTSMGLDGPKTLLPVRGDMTFLDVLVEQVLRARRETGARLPLLFMNSFRTREATLAHLERYPDLAVDGLPVDFLQGFEPKLTADTLEPVEWPADPDLEWCPPGHGDIYTSLVGTGLLDALLERGFRYVSIANGDNLGAGPNATLAGWFAASGAPYAAEVCTRTANDRKGGHLAVRKADGQLILRDTAQTRPEEMDYFTDEHRHPYFHANNLWVDLAALKNLMEERKNVLGLPLIRNEKTVDPSDKASTPVIQLETAMGAAIEVFPGAQAIAVPRDRFLPVKTTNELLLVRSDAFELDADARLVAAVEKLPTVSLDKRHYTLLPDFDARVQVVPSLVGASSLTVEGDWTFASEVTVVGDAHLEDAGAPATVPGGVLGD
ncbi:UTP--glucose-1-phosphate uridylyltransferase [Propioniciclava soli]|uniref:UTP--glucose-1-phosphate uridylyltransferase n=1 Tax=Propioniciclava soli TaxID=2775081 RepID=A0ABZ3C8R3_9ACTN|nr:UTP--glucose-1-phosphate uridylyltransferase [Propioniciclava soli]